MGKNDNVTLKELFANKLVISKLDVMIDGNRTLKEMTDFANSMEINVSMGTINNYKKKREEAQQKSIPLESLLDKRAKSGNIIDIKDKEVVSSVLSDDDDDGTGVYKRSQEKLVNVNQILEEIISKGQASLQEVDFVDIKSTLNAISEFNKVNQGNGGLTLAGVQEMRLQQMAYEAAISSAMLKFVPEDKHQELLEYLKEAEDKYYRDLDVTEEGQRTRRELERLNIIGSN